MVTPASSLNTVEIILVLGQAHQPMAKPTNWNDYAPEQQQAYAQELLASERGQYLIGRALALAIPVLIERGEKSTAEDMELMASALFPTGWSFEVTGTGWTDGIMEI